MAESDCRTLEDSSRNRCQDRGQDGVRRFGWFPPMSNNRKYVALGRISHNTEKPHTNVFICIIHIYMCVCVKIAILFIQEIDNHKLKENMTIINLQTMSLKMHRIFFCIRIDSMSYN